MKPSSGSRSRFGRERFRTVYVNSFGNHRCGTVIHYGVSRDHEKTALADASPCLPDKAISTIPDRIGSGGAASPPTMGRRSPCFVLGTTNAMQAKGAGTCGSHPLNEGGEAKEDKATKVPKAKKIVAPSSTYKDRSNRRAAASSTVLSSQKQIGGCQETQGDAFEFPASLENVIRQQNEKSAVWLGVCKVISKMVEENGHFRNRLLSCSQLPSEGNDVNQDAQNGASCTGTDETIFGLV